VNSESTSTAQPLAGHTTAAAAPVVVVGAGPYGLAVAAHLKGRGVPARVFGEPMASWRELMPRGMFLKSTPSASSISAPKPGSNLEDFLSATGRDPIVGHHQVPLDVFYDYGSWFQERQVPHLERQQVVTVERHPRGFAVALDSGEELLARSVLVASGHSRFAYIPPELESIAPDGPSVTGVLSHSGQHSDMAPFAGREVAVIGAGQSALESAALLHESGASVRLLVRGDQVHFADRPADIDRQGAGTLLKPESPLGPGWSHVGFSYVPGAFRYLPLSTRLWLVAHILGPFGGWWLRERVEGQLPVDLGERVTEASLDGERVVLKLAGRGGSHTVAVDHVMAATGYRPDVDALEFLAPDLRAEIARSKSWPRLNASYESSVPGLFFTGLAAASAFGPLMRFVAGTRFAARRVTPALAR